MANPKRKLPTSNPIKKEGLGFISTLNILSEANRFRIFRSLIKYKKLTSQDIVKILKISNSLVEQHLYKLENEDILLKRVAGPIIYYSLNSKNKKVAAIKNIIQKA